MVSLLLLVTTTALALTSAAAAAAASLPEFSPSWSVHEDQFADIMGSKVSWHGTVYNDLTKFPHPGCRSPISKDPIPNCTATAYVDDTGFKSTYYFFKPEEPDRGVVYFVQPGGQDICYCDMVTLGRWIQCEIPDSLCNPNMVKSATFDGSGSKTFDGKPVDVIEWKENLIVASTQFRLSVQHQTSTPVQYYTTFAEGNKTLGYNQVNWTTFVPRRPDPSAFVLPGRVGGTCGDNVCTAYTQNLRRGVSPALVSSFPGRT